MTRKGWLLFISMSVIWGIPYLFIKIAVQELDPTVVVFARVGIAAFILLPIAVHRKVLRPLRERWLVVAALACVQIAAPFLLISYGEQHITSSLTSLLHNTAAVQVVLAAAGDVLRNRRINSYGSYSYAGIKASWFMKPIGEGLCLRSFSRRSNADSVREK